MRPDLKITTLVLAGLMLALLPVGADAPAPNGPAVANTNAAAGQSEALTPAQVHALFTTEANNGQITITRYNGSSSAVDIPGTINGMHVTSIGNHAFSDCTGMTSVTIPDSVTSIEAVAFRGCTGLTSVTIPDSVTSIEAQAFMGCSSLTSVTIPKNVTSIGDRAFADCAKLKSVVFIGKAPTMGSGVFDGAASGFTSPYPDRTNQPSLPGTNTPAQTPPTPPPPPPPPKPFDTAIIKAAPLEAYGSDGLMTGVSQAAVGQHYKCLRIENGKAVLQDANGNSFKVQADAIKPAPNN